MSLLFQNTLTNAPNYIIFKKIFWGIIPRIP